MALSGLAALASAEGQRQLSIFWTTGRVGTLTEWSQWKVRALAKAWATTRPESVYGRNTWITGLVEAVMKDKRRKAQHTVLDDWAGWHAHTVVAVEGLGLGQVLGSYTPGIGLRPKRLDQGIGGGCDEGHAPWHESEAQLGKRLKAAAGHCTHKFDLESLCKAFPDETHDLEHVTKGDRLNK